MRYEYDAWGNCTPKYLTSNNEYAKITSDYTYNDTTIINRFIAFKNPFRYRSYYYDFETNLYYLNSRYYDPELGRFINADDITTLDVTKIALNGLNLYAYCLNNPVNEVDENGHFIGWLIFSLIIGAIIGGISNTIKAVQNGANGWQALGSFFVGALTGAALAGSLALGIGAGLTAAGIGFSLGISTATAFGLSIGIGAISKGIEYSLNSAIYSTKWDVGEFFASIINGGIQGTINFGLGYFGGKFGAYDSLAPQKWGLIEKLFIADVLKNPIRNIVTLIAWNLGEPITRLLLVSLPSFLQKLIFNKIFN